MKPNPKIKAEFLATLNTIKTLTQKAIADLATYEFDHTTLAAADRTLGWDDGEGDGSLRARVRTLYAYINAQYDAVLAEEYDRKEEEPPENGCGG